MASPLLPGDPRQLGEYWLAGRIGAGGQGVVYEGYGADGRRVAVKALHADFLTDAYREMLRKEVRALQRVSSFCTARVLATDFDHVPPYVVSEYVPGPTLQEKVEKQGPYEPDGLHRLAIGIATALTAIHQAGVIHRDLKPPNVLIGPDGPRVIDFGIARTEEMSRSATGQLKGTPRWMAPELFRGERATPAVDVWAWGAIVLFAATGRPPFDGETFPALIYQVLNHTPETGALPEPLRSLTARALSQDPAARPEPAEILDGLLGGAQEEPLEAGRQAAMAVIPDMTLPPSLAETCEAAYQSLDPQAREAVPRVLLRLVAVRANAQDTVRRATIEELRDEADEQTLPRVLHVLAEASVIQDDDGVVSLGTPALLRAWPRLRDWVEAERDGLDVHHALADSARFWDEHGRKNGDLYQGSALDQALLWTAAERRHLALNTLERGFLDSALSLNRRRGRTRTLMIAALSLLLVLALGATALSVVQNRTVTRQRDAALSAKIANLAVSMRRTDPETARRLAIAAESLDPDGLDAHNALLTTYHQWEEYVFRSPEAKKAEWVNTDGTGSLIAYYKGPRLALVDVKTRRTRHTLNLSHDIGYAGFSFDGRSMAVGEFVDDKVIVRFWDTQTGKPSAHHVEAGPGRFELSWSGNYLIWRPSEDSPITKDVRDTFFVFDAKTGKTVLEIPFAPQHWVVSPDKGILVTVRKGAIAEVWDLGTGKKNGELMLLNTKDPIKYISYSPDARFIAFKQGGSIYVYNTRPFSIRGIYTVEEEDPIVEQTANLVFSQDGEYLAFRHMVWSTRRSSPAQPLVRYSNEYCPLLTFGPGGRSLRCIDGEFSSVGIDLGSMLSQQRLTAYPGGGDKFGAGFVREAEFSDDASRLMTFSSGFKGLEPFDEVATWDTEKLTMIGAKPNVPDMFRELWFSSDGSQFADIHEKGHITVWDAKTMRQRSSWETGHSLSSSYSAAFSPDGKILILLLSGQGKPFVQFWDVASQRLLKELTHETTNIDNFPSSGAESSLPFTKDGSAVVVGSDYGIVEFPSGRIRTAPPGHPINKLRALSPDDKYLVSVDQEQILIYDAKTLELDFTLRTPASGRPAAFSRGAADSLLATTDERGRIRLWDLDSRRSLGLPLTGLQNKTIKKSSTDVEDLVFSPDNAFVLSVTAEGYFRKHLVDPARLRSELCKKVGSLSRADWETYIPELPYRKTC